MGMADIAEVLWRAFETGNPANPSGRPRPFVPSNGRSMLIYSPLQLTGYDLPMSELQNSVSYIQNPGSPGSGLHRYVENHYRLGWGRVLPTPSGWRLPRKPGGAV